jgi:hypothetical protein
MRGSPSSEHPPQQSGLSRDISHKTPGDTVPPKTLLLTNPFANVAELDALKRDFSRQPNWKASVSRGRILGWYSGREYCKVAKDCRQPELVGVHYSGMACCILRIGSERNDFMLLAL